MFKQPTPSRMTSYICATLAALFELLFDRHRTYRGRTTLVNFCYAPVILPFKTAEEEVR